MSPSLHTLLAGAAAAALGLTAFAGRFDAPHSRALVVDAPAAERRLPELPRGRVDTAPGSPGGRAVHVAAGGDLQAAIDTAQPGDTIALDAGATYRGPFRLPKKEGSGWIVITSANGRGLPRPGQRVGPSHAKAMAKLVAASGDAVVDTDPGAHHYRLIGLEIAPADGVFLRALVQIGAKETDAASLPHHVIVDRCYLHGDPKKGARRGVALNGRESAVIDSYLADFKEVGNDSQAIAGWNGAGPFKIANNYLEAAGENVMFGGGDPAIADLVPSDIEVVGNHLSKPLRWKENDPSYEGTNWAVKNLFELKNARRVLVDGNVFEYNWPHAQNGFAILFTVRNQDGGAPWSIVEDVTFTRNIVRHVAAGMNILARDDIHRSQQAQRIAITDNLFTDVGGRWGKGRLFQLLDGARDVTIAHNTALHSGGIVWAGDKAPHTGFAFENNIVAENNAGVVGDGTGDGRPTLDRFFPSAVFRRNAIVGGNAEKYPGDNFFPATLEQVGFAAPRTSDFRLVGSSRYRQAAADGRDLGADIDALPHQPSGTNH